MSITFPPFPKIPRLNRNIVVTEKIDGTNASIWIGPVFDEDDNLQVDPADILDSWTEEGDRIVMRAGSRTRWLQATKQGDNLGFATWVEANSQALRGLGRGHHFGEWWGRGIQRKYGMAQRVFSLFNVARWADYAADKDGEPLPPRPACCDVVPVLYEGPMDMFEIRRCIRLLDAYGSRAAARYPDVRVDPMNLIPRVKPEGVIVYHQAASQMFKVTLENDEVPKTQLTPKLTRVEHATVRAPYSQEKHQALLDRLREDFTAMIYPAMAGA